MDTSAAVSEEKRPRLLDFNTPFCQSLAAAKDAVEQYWEDQEFPASESDEEYEAMYLPPLMHNDRGTLQILRAEVNRFNIYARMLGTSAVSTRPYVRAVKALRTKHEIEKLYDLLSAKVSEFEFDVSLLGSRTEASIGEYWYRNVDDWTRQYIAFRALTLLNITCRI